MDLLNLTQSAAFAGIPESMLAPVLEAVEFRDIDESEAVAIQGAVGEELVLVLNGRLDSAWRDAGDGLEYIGQAYGIGDFVGLTEILLNTPHPLTVWAAEPTKVAVIHRSALLAACTRDPHFSAEMHRALAERLHAERDMRSARVVDLSRLRADETLWTLLPLVTIQKFKALPLARNGRMLVVGFVNPGDVTAIDDIQRLLPTLRIRPVALDGVEFDRFLRARVVPAVMNAQSEGGVQHTSLEERWFQAVKQKVHDVQVVDVGPTTAMEERGRSVPGEVVVQMLNRLIGEALELGASDIHIEPGEETLTVRYRVDGRLKRRPEPLDARLHAPLISRVKALGHMDIAEKRKPQDGRLTIEHGSRQIDFRLSTVPSRYGEKMVLRILDPGSILIDMERLIVHEPTYRALRWMIDQPQGLVIVAGPTGSGKTTTIYSALLRLREQEINIVTIEDPIEYTIEGITQVQVNDAAGVTFPLAIRHFLRQDPDVILVGETRDPMTAATTVEAALTGHLVFTSLHANDAPGALVRLREMGLETFLLANTVIGVISQRLVRRVCPYCRQPAVYRPEMVRPLGIFPEEDVRSYTFFRGKGCLHCNFQGYRGRVGAYEVLRIDDRLRPAIAAGLPLQELARIAREAGLLQPLAENCRHLLVNGFTTPEEITRVLFTTD